MNDDRSSFIDASSACDGLPVDLDLRDIHPAASPMAAARHQIREPDLIHLAQIDVGKNVAGRDDALDVETQPVNVREIELGEQPVARRAVRAIADDPRAVREL